MLDRFGDVVLSTTRAFVDGTYEYCGVGSYGVDAVAGCDDPVFVDYGTIAELFWVV